MPNLSTQITKKALINFIIILGLSSLVLNFAACQSTKESRRPPVSSRIASITLGEFVPEENAKQWDLLRLRILPAEDNKDASKTLSSIDKNIQKSQFEKPGQTKASDATVLYGRYKILLTYLGKDGAKLFESCQEEKDKIHDIATPEYRVEVNICDASGEKVPPKDPGQSPQSPGGSSPAVKPVSNENLAGKNPFEGRILFVNPSYRDAVEKAASRLGPSGQLSAANADLRAKMLKMRETPTAIWIDKTAAIALMEPALQTARSQIKAQNQSIIVTFVVYNLPERDCAAYASAGELFAADRGLERYKNDYILPIKAILQKYPDVPTALIIEPDSLPNLATNMGVAKCTVAAPLYREATAFAIKNLALPHTALYLDTAHGGWLGWPDNLQKMARIFKEVLDAAGGHELIRGFATNVSNYSPVTRASPDPNSDAYYQFNPARDELTFVNLLRAQLESVGVTGKQFIIDTSRNGQPAARKVWGNWCNIKGAGLGIRPTIKPQTYVDAYLWVKPPGESDGISDATQKRFDIKCRSEDSMENAPEAGQWFDEHFKILIRNANPAL